MGEWGESTLPAGCKIQVIGCTDTGRVWQSNEDNFLVADLAGWVTAVNLPFEKFHGVEKEQLLGFGYRALLKKIQHFYEEPGRQLHRFIELIGNPETVADDEVKIRGEKQGMMKIRRYSAPVRDESGKIYGRFFVFRNLNTNH